MNPVTQLEQQLTHLNTPAVVQAFRTYGPRPTAAQILMDAPATYNVTTPTATVTVAPTGGTFSYGPWVLIGGFGVSLLATILGQGTVRTLGVVGMLGTAGLFMFGGSQIH